MKEEKITIGAVECTLRTDVDAETVMSVFDDVLRVDLVNIGEGKSGDYDADDPDDENLLRFDVYVYNPDGDEEYLTDWVEVEDASYCTLVTADTEEPVLRKVISMLYREYRDAIDSYEEYLYGSSVKKLGERLSWISADWFAAA